MLRFFYGKQKGVALFISVLMTMSLSIIALATLSRLSETAHTTGKDLQDRRLLAYAYSAVNIVNGELRALVDSTFECEDTYSITGGTGGSTTTNDGTFKYYPRDISLVPNSESSNIKPLFAYRATARRLSTDANASMYGLNSDGKVKYSKDKNACYDVTVDVREVVYVGNSTYVTDKDHNASIAAKPAFALGKMKTIGLVSCFSREGENKVEE